MDIGKATEHYEAWLAGRIHLIQADLDVKHQRMAEGRFPFLRATFYRWVQLFPKVCPDLAAAPSVLSVGDLHVENFGTWRDSEGRMAWGVNDFDEAFPMPYTNDLVRLAASAILAVQENHLTISDEEACKAILEGYAEGLHKGGRPFVLVEHHVHLRDMATSQLRDPAHFWDKLDGLPTVKEKIASSVVDLLEHSMPERGLSYRVAHRQAGLGSLGRRRYTAIAEWRGGKIAREVKELVVSAWVWERADKTADILYQEIASQAVRDPDPFLSLHGRWIVRRLSPYCSRIELTTLPQAREEVKLLHAMGWETANIHLGSKEAAGAVRDDLKKRHPQWLRKATEEMVKVTTDDWKEWKRGYLRA